MPFKENKDKDKGCCFLFTQTPLTLSTTELAHACSAHLQGQTLAPVSIVFVIPTLDFQEKAFSDLFIASISFGKPFPLSPVLLSKFRLFHFAYLFFPKEFESSVFGTCFGFVSNI